jgi:hypothetical protein
MRPKLPNMHPSQLRARRQRTRLVGNAAVAFFREAISMPDQNTTCDNPIRDDHFEECSALADTELERRFPRSELHRSASATIYPPDGKSKQPVRCSVTMRDLSERGFGITHTELLAPRQRVEVEVGTKHLIGDVLWCRCVQRGVYIAGCRLVDSK